MSDSTNAISSSNGGYGTYGTNSGYGSYSKSANQNIKGIPNDLQNGYYSASIGSGHTGTSSIFNGNISPQSKFVAYNYNNWDGFTIPQNNGTGELIPYNENNITTA